MSRFSLARVKMIISNNNNTNSEDENDVSSQYYAANNDALDVMIRPDQIHLRNFRPLGTTTSGNGKSLLSLSADSTQRFDVESNPSQRRQQQHEEEENEATRQSWKELAVQFYKKDSLLIDVLLAIVVAKIYPRLGAEFLYPEITAHWVAVIVIFCKCVCVCVCFYFFLLA